MTGTIHRIGIVEDDAETRHRLARIIGEHEQLEVVAEADSVADAMAILEEHTLDVLLVDIGLPDGSGIDVITEGAKLNSEMDIMVVTVFGDSRNVIRAIEAGANGYLLKDGETAYIADAILQLIGGGSPISASIARHILTRFKDAPNQSEAQSNTSPNTSFNTSPNDSQAVENTPTEDTTADILTPREKEVLTLISKGYRYEEIADTLSISYHTVTSHIKQIYRKLAVHSRGEAVFEATRLGLVR